MSPAVFRRGRSGTRELYYQGALYDILKTRTLPSGDMEVSLLQDEQEQVVLHRLGLCLDSRNSKNSNYPVAGFLLKILSQIFVLPEETSLAFQAPAEATSPLIALVQLPSGFQPSTLSPPPWRVG